MQEYPQLHFAETSKAFIREILLRKKRKDFSKNNPVMGARAQPPPIMIH